MHHSTGVHPEDKSSTVVKTQFIKIRSDTLAKPNTAPAAVFHESFPLYFALLLKEKQIKLQVACLDWHVTYTTSVGVPCSEGWLSERNVQNYTLLHLTPLSK